MLTWIMSSMTICQLPLLKLERSLMNDSLVGLVALVNSFIDLSRTSEIIITLPHISFRPGPANYLGA